VKVGDVLETAIWADGRETAEQRQRFKRDMGVALNQIASGLVLGPIIFTEKRPGDERVPEVPDHIQGPDVRLLIAEAIVIARLPDLNVQQGAFIAELEPDDLARLRRITRMSYALQKPFMVPLTDRQCDTIINDLGPDAALDTLRAGLAKVLH